MRLFMTTGQVAKNTKCAPRTVSKWFDANLILGYKVPDSPDRRLIGLRLVRFFKSRGIPLGPDLRGIDENVVVLHLGGSVETTRAALDGTPMTLVHHPVAPDLKSMILEYSPLVAVIDASMEGAQAVFIALGELDVIVRPIVIVLSRGVVAGEFAPVTHALFPLPCEASTLQSKVYALLGSEFGMVPAAVVE